MKKFIWVFSCFLLLKVFLEKLTQWGPKLVDIGFLWPLGDVSWNLSFSFSFSFICRENNGGEVNVSNSLLHVEWEREGGRGTICLCIFHFLLRSFHFSFWEFYTFDCAESRKERQDRNSICTSKPKCLSSHL